MAACGARIEERARAQAAEIRRQIRLGNLAVAEELAQRGWSQWRGRPQSEFAWEFRLLYAQVLALQARPQPVLELLAEEPPAGERHLRWHARRWMCLGRARFLEGDYPQARRLLEEARRAAVRAGDALLEAEVVLWLASAHARVGDAATADEACRQAFQLAAAHQDLYLQTAALGNRGFIRLNGSRYDEAIPFFEEALRLAEKTGARRFVATTYGNLGRCYEGLGDYVKAAVLLSKAAALSRELQDANGQQLWLGGLGEVFYLEGEYAQAERHYRAALEIARRLGHAYFTLMWLNRLTELALERRELERAEDYNRQALEISRQVVTRDAGIWSHLFRARLAAERGRSAEAEPLYRHVLATAAPVEEASVIWNAHAGLADLYAGLSRFREAEVQFERALALLEQTRSRLRRDEWKLSFQAASLRFYQQYVDYLVSRGRSERALEVAESSRARLLAQKLGLRQSGNRETAAARFRRIAAELKATLLSYWLAPRRSFLWVVQPQRIACYVLPPEPEIRRLVEALNGATENLRDLLATENPAARRLHEILIRPAEPWLPRGARVVVAPDGVLHEVNLETLVSPHPAPHYWIQDIALALTPSLGLLAAARNRSTTRPSLLLIGDPVPSSPEFPRLPAVEAEIRSIRQGLPLWHQVVLTREQAHPGAYREARPERFRLIHFAAHATATRDNPLDSAVILSAQAERSKLYAREILEAPLNAELVTLSACRGAAGRLYAGEGMLGFAWAFLQAGARNVIAGLWDVHDASTAALMQQLYREIAAGRSPGDALRTAKLHLIASRSAWSKPFYWAAFQLYTRARPF